MTSRPSFSGLARSRVQDPLYSSLKVLCAEDDAVARGLLATLLRRRFSQVLEASDGLEALNILETESPDILVTDVRMPGLDGLELAARLSRRTPAVPVVVLSAHSDLEYFQRAVASGVDRYVIKPIQPPELWAAMEHCARLAINERQARLAATVIEASGSAIIVTDAHGNVQLVNPAFTQITGYTAEEVLGKSPNIVDSGTNPPELMAQLQAQIERTGSWNGRLWNRRKNGEPFEGSHSVRTVRAASGELQHVITVFQDSTDRLEEEQNLRRRAGTDALTGLPNRSLLLDRLSQGLARARREGLGLAVCFLDLDDFKPVNDRYGHPEGDAVLRAVAARLRARLRECDTVGRLGGDEFLVLLEGIRVPEDALRVCRDLIASLEAPISVGEHAHQLGGSIGVALYPEHGDDPDLLIRQADAAMYLAKAAGHKRVELPPPGTLTPSSPGSQSNHLS